MHSQRRNEAMQYSEQPHLTLKTRWVHSCCARYLVLHTPGKRARYHSARFTVAVMLWGKLFPMVSRKDWGTVFYILSLRAKFRVTSGQPESVCYKLGSWISVSSSFSYFKDWGGGTLSSSVCRQPWAALGSLVFSPAAGYMPFLGGRRGGGKAREKDSTVINLMPTCHYCLLRAAKAFVLTGRFWKASLFCVYGWDVRDQPSIFRT